MKCPNCHLENRDGAKYCNECGFPLSGRIAEIAAAADKAESEHSRQSASLDETTRITRGFIFDENTFADTETDVGVVAADSKHDETEKESHTAHTLSRGKRPAHAACDISEFDEKESMTDDVEDFDMVHKSTESLDSEESAASSGPLDPACVPQIDVVGVNVDEDGNAFDFTPIDDSEQNAVSVGEENDGDTAEKDEALESAEEAYPEEASAYTAFGDDTSRDDTTDLSGFEQLVDSSYVPPAAVWRTGDTMEMPRVEGEEAPDRKEYRAPNAPNVSKRKKLKVVLIILAILCVVAAVAAAITFKMELWGGKIVPDIVGASQADATYVLEAKGFSVRATQVKSDDVEGIVLLMDPSAGARLEEGTEIVIHVSIARTIPSIVGKTQEEARSILENEGFLDVTFTEVKSNETEGSVLSVTPEEGTKSKAAAPITIEVAQAYTVPDVVGKTKDAALAELEGEGYVVTTTEVYTEEVSPGAVVSTDPAAGTKLPTGSSVTLALAKSRAAELISATHTYFQSASANTFNIGGITYEVQPDTLDVKYEGNETTRYSLTARKVESHFWDILGIWDTKYGDDETISGTITWTSDNGIQSASPSISIKS